MAFSPSSPITGAAVTGLTSPTYTFVTDTAPDVNAKQYAVTALGGTQTGVDINSVSKPFTFTMFRPRTLRSLPQANPVTGIIKNVPNNVWKLNARKGMAPSANQIPIVCLFSLSMSIPAGTDTYEPEEIRAAVSLFFGMGYSNASGISESLITGVL